jgi:hypothetical protein
VGTLATLKPTQEARGTINQPNTMKIIRTKVMPKRSDKPGPYKITAIDATTGKACVYGVTESRIHAAHHVAAARFLANSPGAIFAYGPFKGNDEWIHIEQVNTWVS